MLTASFQQPRSIHNKTSTEISLESVTMMIGGRFQARLSQQSLAEGDAGWYQRNENNGWRPVTDKVYYFVL